MKKLIQSIGIASALLLAASAHSSPALQAETTLSTDHAAVGETVTATFKLKALKKLSNLELSFLTCDSLKPVNALQTKEIKRLSRGKSISLSADFIVQDDAPCFVLTEMHSTTKSIRPGGTFGATLNGRQPQS